jgi:penicillin-binding protein 2
MIEPVRDRHAPISPQLALRVAIMGGIAFALFAIIFFRLWYLQVLSGDQYLKQANDNRVRLQRVQAPRGAIVDRNGRVLVENRPATVVTLDPTKLPASERIAAAEWGQRVTTRSKRPKGRRGPMVAIPAPTTPALAAELRRLGSVLGMGAGSIQAEIIRQLAILSYAEVKVRVDVDAARRDYLLERKSQFPALDVQQLYLRRYPFATLAAQVLGNVGEVSGPELKLRRFRGVTQGTVVGQGGVEWTYDRYLRGIDGSSRITVDALGNPKGETAAQPPIPGKQVQLTIDSGLQQKGQSAMAGMIASGPGTAGAFVAMDPRDGQVLALGSFPTFDPSILTHPISSQKRYEQLLGAAAGSPQVDRAIQGLYPTGSTFKPITSFAALGSGVLSPGDVIDDSGCVQVGDAQRCNARHASNGPVDLVRALQVSSDVFFYTMGMRLNPVAGQPLQRWAHRLGLGQPTGIDLPGESGGLVPDRAWRAAIGRAELRYEKKHHTKCCTLSDMRPWTFGDEVNLAVGQGDLQATPMQMATAYAAIENGGKIVRPHLGLRVLDSSGRLLETIQPPPSHRIALDPTALGLIREGLHLAASTPSGTSGPVFKGWNQFRYPVFGKTGTAQHILASGQESDQSWYVAYVPDSRRPIVIATTIENGGFGADAAAPVTCRMLAWWYHEPKASCAAGGSATF